MYDNEPNYTYVYNVCSIVGITLLYLYYITVHNWNASVAAFRYLRFSFHIFLFQFTRALLPLDHCWTHTFQFKQVPDKVMLSLPSVCTKCYYSQTA